MNCPAQSNIFELSTPILRQWTFRLTLARPSTAEDTVGYFSSSQLALLIIVVHDLDAPIRIFLDVRRPIGLRAMRSLTTAIRRLSVRLCAGRLLIVFILSLLHRSILLATRLPPVLLPRQKLPVVELAVRVILARLYHKSQHIKFQANHLLISSDAYVPA